MKVVREIAWVAAVCMIVFLFMNTVTDGSVIRYFQLQDPDDATRLGEFDNIFKVPVSIDVAHHEIHEGDHYSLAYNEDVANGDSAVVLIVTPNTTKWAHWVYETKTQGETIVSLLEGVTTTLNGTTLATFNGNRNSANTAGVLMFANPPSHTGGTVLDIQQIGSGKTAGGTAVRSDRELILKQNTKYILKFFNQTGSANSEMNVIFNWYEHTSE
jgi:hypothetical protein